VAKERIVQVLSWHQIQTDAQVGEALRQVKEAGLIPEEKVRLGVVGDGAKWIWNQVKELFPSAVQILDYYHLSQRLHKVALQEREWVEATKARLSFGYLDWVLLDLEGMKPRDGEAAEEIRKLLGYLKENQGRVKYGALRRKGYLIGSGGIESANKFISHVRLKRSGAWWYVERANMNWRCGAPNTMGLLRGSLSFISRGPCGVRVCPHHKNCVMLPARQSDTDQEASYRGPG
jgi:hypothetical protein